MRRVYLADDSHSVRQGCLAWLRIGDLRLRDNPALFHAAKGGRPVAPVFTWFPHEERKHVYAYEAADRRDWCYEGTTLQALLPQALASLDKDLNVQYQSRLWIANEVDKGGAVAALLDLADRFGVKEIHYNRRHEPVEREREAELERLCKEMGITTRSHSGFLFREPEQCPIFRAVGNGLHVFKAFWDGWHKGGEIRQALPAPDECLAPKHWSSNGLLTVPFAGSAGADWPFGNKVPISRVTGKPLTEDALNLSKHWQLTEDAAHREFERFQYEGGLSRYKGSITRDAGPQSKESKLSPYFRLGLLSMVDAWWTLDRTSEQAKKWLRRCAWRDYSYWMLHHWSDLPEEPMRMAYAEMKWSIGSGDRKLEAWRRGETGFPLVDAAMREMLSTGYLQQNMRHTVGQFLVECLGADWRDGEEWFHLALADSDLAINSMMWQHQGAMGVSQWLVGIDCHPVRHASKADPTGDYVRKWVPELAHLPRKYLHAPWMAPFELLAGTDYPERIVEDVDAARAAFVSRARRCRSEASAEYFSNDGCDLLSLPSSSGLTGNGIRALTERCFKDRSEGGYHRVSSKGASKGVGKRKAHRDEGEFQGHHSERRSRWQAQSTPREGWKTSHSAHCDWAAQSTHSTTKPRWRKRGNVTAADDIEWQGA